MGRGKELKTEGTARLSSPKSARAGGMMGAIIKCSKEKGKGKKGVRGEA